MSDITTINELLLKEAHEKRMELEIDNIKLKTHIAKLEMVLDFISTHHRLPELAYELLPRLQRGAGGVGGVSLPNEVQPMLSSGDVCGEAAQEKGKADAQG